VEALAAKLSLTAKKVYRRAHAGKIPGTIMLDGELRFDEAKIDAWLETLTLPCRA
jgi:predicted DNA-binding transcriptional regulator AlpA